MRDLLARLLRDQLGPIFLKYLGTDVPWKSFTIWGAFVLLLGDTAVSVTCGPEGLGVLGQEVCDTVDNWNEKLGMALAFVGLRRK